MTDRKNNEGIFIICSPGPSATDIPPCHSRWTGPRSRGDGKLDLETCDQREFRRIGIAMGINPNDAFFLSMPEGFTCEAKCHNELDEDGIQAIYENSNTVRTFECKGGAGDCFSCPPSETKCLFCTNGIGQDRSSRITIFLVSNRSHLRL
jgi:hypothetical protein